MDLRDYVRNQLNSVKCVTTRALDGLSHQELMWRPGPECNSIGLILLHQARFEDAFVPTRMQTKPQLWESDKWYRKLNLTLGDTGSHYTPQHVVSFTVPEPKEMLAYADAVRARTVEYLNNITPEEFDRKISDPRLGETTVGAVIASHTCEVSSAAWINSIDLPGQLPVRR